MSYFFSSFSLFSSLKKLFVAKLDYFSSFKCDDDKYDDGGHHDGGHHDGGGHDDGGCDGGCPTGDPIGTEVIRGTAEGDLLETTAGYASTIAGNSGDDTINGGDYADYILGNRGDDLIKGGCGDDSLYGGENDDTIYGGDGDDFISGDEGADLLYGGEGADTFEFESTDIGDGAVDTIADFDGAEDIISIPEYTAAELSFDLAANGSDVEIYVNDVLEVVVLDSTVGEVEAATAYAMV
ncbi:calcium-binding protein [Alloyangia pacifica]|uniref:Alkaline phosphatase n=1 Tax=Alloyangia pacifica TaxID=311180 RepID=A0A1I6T3I0_9RHOB|nr:calcium-binding protein [Alloyangia pacifica]SDG96495.1 hypothetical protein SAMN04488245_105273 [Alloyangia pacifica]SFS83829.1 hypothetical protein SAMN04488050_105273 [Alloyangia pacifica]